MRLLLLSLSLTLVTGLDAFAQLDKILAPVDLAVAAPSTSLEKQKLPKEALHLLTVNEALPQLQKQLVDRFSVNGDLKLQTATSWGRILVPATYQLTIVDF